jgi:hypothetical protein
MKKSPKMWPNPCFVTSNTLTCTVEKCSPRITSAISENDKKLAKENNRPKGQITQGT